jgi:HSP20 family molecular chaperone IbpA
MSRVVFNSPFLLGFDHFERALDRVAKGSTDGYPPYNIEQTGPDRLRITLAVAGFASDDLLVQIEDTQLVIRGKQADDQDRIYLHRGIAGRQFQKSFVLDNGLLHIDLRRPSIEPKVRKVEIRTPANGKAKGRIEVG